MILDRVLGLGEVDKLHILLLLFARFLPGPWMHLPRNQLDQDGASVGRIGRRLAVDMASIGSGQGVSWQSETSFPLRPLSSRPADAPAPRSHLIIRISNVKQQVDIFVGKLTF